MINKTIQKTKDYVKTIVYGRQNFPPQMRRLLAQYGNTPIVSLAVSRSPLPGLMNTVLDKFSFGLYYNRIMNSPYDELFHLRLDLTLEDGNIAMIEKNEVLTMLMNPPQNKGAQVFELPPDELPPGLTVNSILQGAHKIQGDKFFKYGAITNNCQDFVLACLNGSKIYNKTLQLFVKQDVTGLFGDLVSLRKGVNTLTDIAAKANELIYGSGIHPIDTYKNVLNHLVSHIVDKEEPVDKRDYSQAIELINQIKKIKGGAIKGSDCIQSVVFEKPEWTHSKAVKWLKSHGFKGLELDEKPNVLRYRQLEPEPLYKEGYIFRNKKIGDNIQLVIGYKDKTIYKKYNKMSSSKDEKKIIDKMHKLAEEVHKHQSIHGGKINIAHAFKNLGHSVESGFHQASNYVTAPKGGLASALVHQGIPIVTGAIGAAGAEALAPEGGPVSGFLGRQAGKYVGNQIANKIGQKTGTGIKKGSQEAKDKMARIRAMKKK
jgi:hypothetical protein